VENESIWKGIKGKEMKSGTLRMDEGVYLCVSERGGISRWLKGWIGNW